MIVAKRQVTYRDSTFEISYEKILPSIGQEGADSKILLLLHGWGSNKEVMKIAFAKYFKDFCHIYVDMPGFGDSPNEVPLKTNDYAGIIEQFVRVVCGVEARECLIVGHSFGGKVALLCNPKAMILLSSAGIRVPKSLKTRSKIALTKFGNKLGFKKLGKLLRSSDVNTMNEGMYKTFKNVVDEDYAPLFGAYNGRAYIFWGKADSATPLFCAHKIHSLIARSVLYELEGDHYFFLKQGALIEQLYTQASKEYNGV